MNCKSPFLKSVALLALFTFISTNTVASSDVASVISAFQNREDISHARPIPTANVYSRSELRQFFLGEYSAKREEREVLPVNDKVLTRSDNTEKPRYLNLIGFLSYVLLGNWGTFYLISHFLSDVSYIQPVAAFLKEYAARIFIGPLLVAAAIEYLIPKFKNRSVLNRADREFDRIQEIALRTQDKNIEVGLTHVNEDAPIKLGTVSSVEFGGKNKETRQILINRSMGLLKTTLRYLILRRGGLGFYFDDWQLANSKIEELETENKLTLASLHIGFWSAYSSYELIKRTARYGLWLVFPYMLIAGIYGCSLTLIFLGYVFIFYPVKIFSPILKLYIREFVLRESSEDTPLVDLVNVEPKTARSELRTKLLPEEVTDARAIEFYTTHRELLSFFAAYSDAKKHGRDSEAKALLKSVRRYAAHLDSYIREVDSNHTAEKAYLKGLASRSPPELIKISRDLKIKYEDDYIPRFEKAHAERDIATLDKLNVEVVNLLKRRLKAQLLFLKSYLENPAQHQTQVPLVIYGIIRTYWKISYEHSWRRRRAEAKTAIERFRTVDASGYLAYTLYYGREPVLRVEREKSGEIKLKQWVWKNVEVQGGEKALVPVLTEIPFDTMSAAYRSRIHAITSQEEDHAQIFYHGLAIEDVLEVLNQILKKKSAPSRDIFGQVISSLNNTYVGPNGKKGLGRKTVRIKNPKKPSETLPMPGPDIQTAISFLKKTEVSESDIKNTVQLIESAKAWVEARLEDIARKKKGTANKRDHLYDLMRDEAVKIGLEHMREIINQEKIAANNLDQAINQLQEIDQTYFRFIVRSSYYNFLQRNLRTVISVAKTLRGIISRGAQNSRIPAQVSGMQHVISSTLSRIDHESIRRRSELRLAVPPSTAQHLSPIAPKSELRHGDFYESTERPSENYGDNQLDVFRSVRGKFYEELRNIRMRQNREKQEKEESRRSLFNFYLKRLGIAGLIWFTVPLAVQYIVGWDKPFYLSESLKLAWNVVSLLMSAAGFFVAYHARRGGYFDKAKDVSFVTPGLEKLDIEKANDTDSIQIPPITLSDSNITKRLFRLPPNQVLRIFVPYSSQRHFVADAGFELRFRGYALGHKHPVVVPVEIWRIGPFTERFVKTVELNGRGAFEFDPLNELYPTRKFLNPESKPIRFAIAASGPYQDTKPNEASDELSHDWLVIGNHWDEPIRVDFVSGLAEESPINAEVHIEPSPEDRSELRQSKKQPSKTKMVNDLAKQYPSIHKEYIQALIHHYIGEIKPGDPVFESKWKTLVAYLDRLQPAVQETGRELDEPDSLDNILSTVRLSKIEDILARKKDFTITIKPEPGRPIKAGAINLTELSDSQKKPDSRSELRSRKNSNQTREERQEEIARRRANSSYSRRSQSGLSRLFLNGTFRIVILSGLLGAAGVVTYLRTFSGASIKIPANLNDSVFPIFGLHTMDEPEASQLLEERVDQLIQAYSKDNVLILKEIGTDTYQPSDIYPILVRKYPELAGKQFREILFSHPDKTAEFIDWYDQGGRELLQKDPKAGLRLEIDKGHTEWGKFEAGLILRKGVRFAYEQVDGEAWVNWFQQYYLFIDALESLLVKKEFIEFQKIARRFSETFIKALVRRDRLFAEQIKKILSENPGIRIVFHRGYEHRWLASALLEGAKSELAFETEDKVVLDAANRVYEGKTISDEEVLELFFHEALSRGIGHGSKKPKLAEMHREFEIIYENIRKAGGAEQVSRKLMEEFYKQGLKGSEDFYRALNQMGIVTDKAWKDWYQLSRSELRPEIHISGTPLRTRRSAPTHMKASKAIIDYEVGAALTSNGYAASPLMKVRAELRNSEEEGMMRRPIEKPRVTSHQTPDDEGQIEKTENSAVEHRGKTEGTTQSDANENLAKLIAQINHKANPDQLLAAPVIRDQIGQITLEQFKIIDQSDQSATYYGSMTLSSWIMKDRDLNPAVHDHLKAEEAKKSETIPEIASSASGLLAKPSLRENETIEAIPVPDSRVEEPVTTEPELRKKPESKTGQISYNEYAQAWKDYWNWLETKKDIANMGRRVAIYKHDLKAALMESKVRFQNNKRVHFMPVSLLDDLFSYNLEKDKEAAALEEFIEAEISKTADVLFDSEAEKKRVIEQLGEELFLPQLFLAFTLEKSNSEIKIRPVGFVKDPIYQMYDGQTGKLFQAGEMLPVMTSGINHTRINSNSGQNVQDKNRILSLLEAAHLFGPLKWLSEETVKAANAKLSEKNSRNALAASITNALFSPDQGVNAMGAAILTGFLAAIPYKEESKVVEPIEPFAVRMPKLMEKILDEQSPVIKRSLIVENRADIEEWLSLDLGSDQLTAIHLLEMYFKKLLGFVEPVKGMADRLFIYHEGRDNHHPRFNFSYLPLYAERQFKAFGAKTINWEISFIQYLIDNRPRERLTREFSVGHVETLTQVLSKENKNLVFLDEGVRKKLTRFLLQKEILEDEHAQKMVKGLRFDKEGTVWLIRPLWDYYDKPIQLAMNGTALFGLYTYLFNGNWETFRWVSAIGGLFSLIIGSFLTFINHVAGSDFRQPATLENIAKLLTGEKELSPEIQGVVNYIEDQAAGSKNTAVTDNRSELHRAELRGTASALPATLAKSELRAKKVKKAVLDKIAVDLKMANHALYVAANQDFNTLFIETAGRIREAIAQILKDIEISDIEERAIKLRQQFAIIQSELEKFKDRDVYAPQSGRRVEREFNKGRKAIQKVLKTAAREELFINKTKNKSVEEKVLGGWRNGKHDIGIGKRRVPRKNNDRSELRPEIHISGTPFRTRRSEFRKSTTQTLENQAPRFPKNLLRDWGEVKNAREVLDLSQTRLGELINPDNPEGKATIQRRERSKSKFRNGITGNPKRILRILRNRARQKLIILMNTTGLTMLAFGRLVNPEAPDAIVEQIRGKYHVPWRSLESVRLIARKYANRELKRIRKSLGYSRNGFQSRIKEAQKKQPLKNNLLSRYGDELDVDVKLWRKMAAAKTIFRKEAPMRLKTLRVRVGLGRRVFGMMLNPEEPVLEVTLETWEKGKYPFSVEILERAVLASRYVSASYLAYLQDRIDISQEEFGRQLRLREPLSMSRITDLKLRVRVVPGWVLDHAKAILIEKETRSKAPRYAFLRTRVPGLNDRLWNKIAEETVFPKWKQELAAVSRSELRNAGQVLLSESEYNGRANRFASTLSWLKDQDPSVIAKTLDRIISMRRQVDDKTVKMGDRNLDAQIGKAIVSLLSKGGFNDSHIEQLSELHRMIRGHMTVALSAGLRSPEKSKRLLILNVFKYGVGRYPRVARSIAGSEAFKSNSVRLSEPDEMLLVHEINQIISRSELRKSLTTIAPRNDSYTLTSDFQSLDSSNAIESHIFENLNSALDNMERVLPAATSDTRNSFGGALGVDLISDQTTANESNVTTIIGLLPSYGNIAEIVLAAEQNINGKMPFVVFVETPLQKRTLEERLPKNHNVLVATEANLDQIMNKIQGRAELRAVGNYSTEDQRYFKQLGNILKTRYQDRLEINPKIFTANELDGLLGIAEIAAGIRSELRKAWAVASAA